MVLHILDVEKKKRLTMAAAQKFVAEKLDGSPRWVRRITGRCPKAGLQGHQLLNLVQLYIERKGDSSLIKRLWRRVIKRQPAALQMRSRLFARFSPSAKSTVVG